MLLGVYQALMNFVLFEQRTESYQNAVKLFLHLQKLQGVLKDGGALPKAKVRALRHALCHLPYSSSQPAEKKENASKRGRFGGKAKKQQLPYPIEKASALLTTSTVCKLLYASSPEIDDEGVRAIMRDQTEFYLFVLAEIEVEASLVRFTFIHSPYAMVTLDAVAR